MQQVASQCAIAIRQARLYQASNQQVSELAKLNQLKDDFLKTISHELKAPMSSIQLAAQTMETLLATKQNPQKSPIFKRVIQIFHQSCDRQKQLVNESEISLCIINTGVEIPVEEQELIFDQFYRIPNNDPWKYGGTGLGLTLVKKLAKMLEATVDVRSENKQTVFCIKFPKKTTKL